ncbi:hypothetical protein JCM16814_10370 [Desulfobaculum senezii]
MYKRTRAARRKEMESVCDALCGVWFIDEGWCKEALRGRVRQRSKLMAFFIGWSKKREKGGAHRCRALWGKAFWLKREQTDEAAFAVKWPRGTCGGERVPHKREMRQSFRIGAF